MSWSGGAGGSHLYNFHKIVKLINLMKLPFWNELFILTGRIYIYNVYKNVPVLLNLQVLS